MPVAKRNFRIRHHHYGEDPVPTAGSDVYDRLLRGSTATAAAGSVVNVAQPQSTVNVSLSSHPARGTIIQQTATLSSINPENKTKESFQQEASSQESFSEKRDESKPSATKNVTQKVRNKNQEEGLPSRNPKSGVDAEPEPSSRASSSRVGQAPTASLQDESFDREPSPNSSSTELSPDRIERWRQLLHSRPSNGDRDAMTGWVLQVLQVSRTESLIPSDDPDATSSSSDVSTLDYSDRRLFPKFVNAIFQERVGQPSRHEVSSGDSSAAGQADDGK